MNTLLLGFDGCPSCGQRVSPDDGLSQLAVSEAHTCSLCGQIYRVGEQRQVIRVSEEELAAKSPETRDALKHSRLRVKLTRFRSDNPALSLLILSMSERRKKLHDALLEYGTPNDEIDEIVSHLLGEEGTPPARPRLTLVK